MILKNCVTLKTLIEKGFALGCVTCKIFALGCVTLKVLLKNCCIGVRYFKKKISMNNFRVTLFEINCTLGQ